MGWHSNSAARLHRGPPRVPLPEGPGLPVANLRGLRDEPSPDGGAQVYFKSSDAFAPAAEGWQTYLITR